jgi:aldose 1-epimerase
MNRDGGEVRLANAAGLELRLLSHGASWVGCSVPLRDGTRRELLLGFDTLDQQRANRAYVGATVGRWANRIAGPVLQRDGRSWPLSTEPGLAHQLHGGPGGFHQRDWTLKDLGAGHAVFGLHSPDGDQGFPGALDMTVRYALGSDLSIEQPGLPGQPDQPRLLPARRRGQGCAPPAPARRCQPVPAR